jgi:hypothetical protein
MVLPAQLTLQWQLKLAEENLGKFHPDWVGGLFLGDVLTAPVIAYGTIYLALPEEHCVVAVKANNDNPRVKWKFYAGGRINTPPTISAGYCVFGCQDGWVYCLDATSGELVWRFLAAERKKRILVFGQLESPWPVPGSVLILDEVVYFTSGTCSGHKGGVVVWAINLRDGSEVWKKELTRRGWRSGYRVLGDVLSSDGENIYLTTGERTVLKINRETSEISEIGVTSTPTFSLRGWCLGTVYGAWWRRLGTALRKKDSNESKYRFGEEENGVILSFSRERLVAYHVDAGNYADTELEGRRQKLSSRPLRDGQLTEDEGWSYQLPLSDQFEAIVLTGELIFAAGPANRATGEGGKIWIFSATDPRQHPPIEIGVGPVFQGMAAANGCLYLTTRDGRLMCFAGENIPLEITTETLPPAILGREYREYLLAAGGKMPYRWRRIQGELPGGFILSEVGEIRGLPEREGKFTFTVEVQDANTPPQVATRELTLTVSKDMAVTTIWEDLGERESGVKKVSFTNTRNQNFSSQRTREVRKYRATSSVFGLGVVEKPLVSSPETEKIFPEISLAKRLVSAEGVMEKKLVGEEVLGGSEANPKYSMQSWVASRVKERAERREREAEAEVSKQKLTAAVVKNGLCFISGFVFVIFWFILVYQKKLRRERPA